jgi:hypothetical protein
MIPRHVLPAYSLIKQITNGQTIEKEKAKNLSGTQGDSAPLKETAPGWNENLAVSHYRTRIGPI